jgi:tetratricopeptide (TPR) repeat protein
MAESRDAANSFVQAKESALDRLREAEKIFLGEGIGAERAGARVEGAGKEAGEDVAIARRVEQLASSAGLAAQLGKNDEAISLYTKALEVPGIDVTTATQIRLSRGVAHYFAGRVAQAVQDFTAVGESNAAPAEQRARALYNRGVAWGQQGETRQAIGDYSTVIAMSDAPSEQRAKALHNRGVAWHRQGETGKAIEDYDAVIAMSDAPDTRRAGALNNRGWIRYTEGDYAAFEADVRAAMEADPSLSGAQFNYGLALLALNRDAEALEAYGRAASATLDGIDEVVNDLRDARATWLSEERAKPVLALLEKIRRLGGGASAEGVPGS